MLVSSYRQKSLQTFKFNGIYDPDQWPYRIWHSKKSPFLGMIWSAFKNIYFTSFVGISIVSFVDNLRDMKSFRKEIFFLLKSCHGEFGGGPKKSVYNEYYTYNSPESITCLFSRRDEEKQNELYKCIDDSKLIFMRWRNVHRIETWGQRNPDNHINDVSIIIFWSAFSSFHKA